MEVFSSRRVRSYILAFLKYIWLEFLTSNVFSFGFLVYVHIDSRMILSFVIKKAPSRVSPLPVNY
jgi:hypothetical protein